MAKAQLQISCINLEYFPPSKPCVLEAWLQNSHVCEKRSKRSEINNTAYKNKGMGELEEDCGFHKLQCLRNCFSSPFYCNRLI